MADEPTKAQDDAAAIVADDMNERLGYTPPEAATYTPRDTRTVSQMIADREAAKAGELFNAGKVARKVAEDHDKQSESTAPPIFPLSKGRSSDSTKEHPAFSAGREQIEQSRRDARQGVQASYEKILVGNDQ